MSESLKKSELSNIDINDLGQFVSTNNSMLSERGRDLKDKVIQALKFYKMLSKGRANDKRY